MMLNVKKRIQVSKPVKAYKVVCVIDGYPFTGPYKLEQVQLDQWVTGTDKMKCASINDVGYHAYKSLNMANCALAFMARSGLLSPNGYPHYVVPCYLRGEVVFGMYYHNKFKGVKGQEMLIKTKHMEGLL